MTISEVSNVSFACASILLLPLLPNSFKNKFWSFVCVTQHFSIYMACLLFYKCVKKIREGDIFATSYTVNCDKRTQNSRFLSFFKCVHFHEKFQLFLVEIILLSDLMDMDGRCYVIVLILGFYSDCATVSPILLIRPSSHLEPNKGSRQVAPQLSKDTGILVVLGPLRHVRGDLPASSVEMMPRAGTDGFGRK